jgi:HEAT repeat protein
MTRLYACGVVRVPTRRPKIARLTRRGDVDRLIKAARYRDYVRDVDGRAVDVAGSVRHDAMVALATFDDPRISEVAIEALDDDQLDVRRAAIFAIRSRADLHAAPGLVEHLGAWDAPQLQLLRDDALDALMEMKHAPLAEPLAHVLSNSHVELTPDGAELQTLGALVAQQDGDEVAARVAAALVDQMAARAEAGRLDATLAVLTALGGAAIEPLVMALDHDRSRPYAALALGRIRSPHAVDSLIYVLADSSRPGRAEAAWALGEVRDPRAITLLFQATVDPDYEVRAAAVTALERFGATAVVLGVAAIINQSASALRPDDKLTEASFNGAGLPPGSAQPTEEHAAQPAEEPPAPDPEPPPRQDEGLVGRLRRMRLRGSR